MCGVTKNNNCRSVNTQYMHTAYFKLNKSLFVLVCILIYKRESSHDDKKNRDVFLLLKVILYCANHNLLLREHSDITGCSLAGHLLNLLTLM